MAGREDREISEFIRKRPPVGNPVSTGRGISEPLAAAKPRADVAQPNAAPRTKPPRIMPVGPGQKPGDATGGAPIQRANQDDITRPNISPSTTKPIAGAGGYIKPAAPGAPGQPAAPGTGNAPNQTVPVGPDGAARPIVPGGTEVPKASTQAGGSPQPVLQGQSTGVEAADQVAQMASTPVEGQELPGSGFAQGAPGEGVPLNAVGQPMTAQEQTLQLKGEAQVARGDTSGFMSGMDAARQQEDLRMAQPSKIPSIPQGTYERVVKERYEEFDKASRTPLTDKQHAFAREDAHQQLEAYGEYPGKGDPKSPAPPIRPGGRSFNPFSGKFTGEKGPNAFTLAGFDMEKAKSEFFSTGGRGPQ